MNTISILLAGLLVTALACGPAEAWSHAGRYGSASGGGGSWSASGDRGGSASGGGGSWSGSGYRGGSASGGEGSWSGSGAYGGSASHTRGEGTTATNQYGGTATHETGSGQTTATTAYGGSATHTYGQGTTATNQYGDTAYHATGSGQTTMTNPYGGSATHYAGYGTTATTSYGTTAYHASGAYYPPPPAAYYPYHPPTTVNYYGSSCGNCGGWSTAGAAAAGAMVGMAAGAAVASSNTAAATSSAYNAGVAAGTSSTAAATSSAYSAGVAAGSANTAAVYNAGVAAGTAGANYMIGGIYPTLPAGCISPKVQGGTYYLCGNTWFQPSYGANGVSYRVVPSAMRPLAPAVARSVLALLLLAGCAQTTVSQQQSYEGPRLARPNRIIVYDFAASASDLPAGYAIAVAAPPHASQTSDDLSLGRKLGAEVAKNLVSELQGMGLPAVPAAGQAPPRMGDITIVGYFVSIDPGNVAQRFALGFGAGAAELRTVVEGYLMTDRGLRRLGEGEIGSEGPKGPGEALPLAMAVASGNPIGLIVSSAVKIGGEASGVSTIEGSAKRTAQEIAQKLKAAAQRQGWI